MNFAIFQSGEGIIPHTFPDTPREGVGNKKRAAVPLRLIRIAAMRDGRCEKKGVMTGETLPSGSVSVRGIGLCGSYILALAPRTGN